MKLTRTYLKQLIKEEMEAGGEAAPAASLGEPPAEEEVQGGIVVQKIIELLPKVKVLKDYLALLGAVQKLAGQITPSPKSQLTAWVRTLPKWVKSL